MSIRDFCFVSQVGNARGLAGVALAILRCRSGKHAAKEDMYLARQVCTRFGVSVSYADCVEQCANGSCVDREARETGMILRWLVANYHLFEQGVLRKVIFNHAHENSWHQRNFSVQLERLLLSGSYFDKNEYGDVYPQYIDHAIRSKTVNGRIVASIPYSGFDILDVLRFITSGTNFEGFNSTNVHGVWRSGQATSFFLSSQAVLRHPQRDYQLLLERTRLLVSRMGTAWNYRIAEATERGWSVFFTNRTWLSYTVPPPPELGTMIVYSFASGRLRKSRVSCRSARCFRREGGLFVPVHQA